MTNLRLTAGLLALSVLAACGGGGDDTLADNAQSQFGRLFAEAFDQGPNDMPKDDPNLVIVYQGVTGVDPTAGPLDL